MYSGNWHKDTLIQLELPRGETARYIGIVGVKICSTYSLLLWNRGSMNGNAQDNDERKCTYLFPCDICYLKKRIWFFLSTAVKTVIFYTLSTYTYSHDEFDTRRSGPCFFLNKRSLVENV